MNATQGLWSVTVPELLKGVGTQAANPTKHMPPPLQASPPKASNFPHLR